MPTPKNDTFADSAFEIEGRSPNSGCNEIGETIRRGKKMRLVFGLPFLAVLLVASTVLLVRRPRNEKTEATTTNDEGDMMDEDSATSPREAKANIFSSGAFVPPPFSLVNPVDLNVYRHDSRPSSSSPNPNIFGDKDAPFPTNSWYENLLLVDPDGQPTNNNRVYTIPYVVDVVGGLRIHPPFVNGAVGDLVQVEAITRYSLTIGAVDQQSQEVFLNQYRVDEWSNLGISLEWNTANDAKMFAPIVRGMPYATVQYYGVGGDGFIPTIFSEVSLASSMNVDNGASTVSCGDGDTFSVQNELELHFAESDFTWLVFVSHPAVVQCVAANGEGFQFQFIPASDTDDAAQFTIRVAISNFCTLGTSAIFCKEGYPRGGDYTSVLRQYASVFPGTATQVRYDIAGTNGNLIFDWNPQTMKSGGNEEALLMYALPHHAQASGSQPLDHCMKSLVGDTCLVISRTGVWTMEQDLELFRPSFAAPRPPRAQDVEAIAGALNSDIVNFRIPENFRRGAGDTYFSGKMIAKLGRILMIAQEFQTLKSSSCTEDDAINNSNQRCLEVLNVTYVNRPKEEENWSNIGKVISELQDTDLPSDETFNLALDELRRTVELWIDSAQNTEAPFVYDATWGGLISCGCSYKDGYCTNNAPQECPAFSDPLLNFGHGYYNDHHFHQGYFIYSAAVVARLDPEWGRRTFEQVLLLIRDMANPSSLDPYFPVFRHKDWYLGNSWAGGIVSPPFFHGRNQESSSEAIAAYEAVGLYGSVMVDAWANAASGGSNDKAMVEASVHVRDVGRLLTATEVGATQRYWQVKPPTNSDVPSSGRRIYPDSYTGRAVGIFWNTMVQFTTWFGNNPVFIYGIQLLPLTAVAEQRDSDLEWVSYMYPDFAASCERTSSVCVSDGWSILQLALMATLGQKDKAKEGALALPSDAFFASGGNGHSLTNTLWYISTRPELDGTPDDDDDDGNDSTPPPDTDPDDGGAPPPETDPEDNDGVDCGCSLTCTPNVLQTMADGHTCHDRIQWLRTAEKKSVAEACRQIGMDEFPNECGGCNCPPSSGQTITCGCKDTCTDVVLSTVVDGHSCLDRIQWLQNTENMSQVDACRQIAVEEYPNECGACNPSH